MTRTDHGSVPDLCDLLWRIDDQMRYFTHDDKEFSLLCARRERVERQMEAVAFSVQRFLQGGGLCTIR